MRRSAEDAGLRRCGAESRQGLKTKVLIDHLGHERIRGRSDDGMAYKYMY